MSVNRAEALARLAVARELVERRVRFDGAFGGWDGREVLCHLGSFARIIGAALRGVAEQRTPSEVELYGRELVPEERAIGDRDAINEAVQREFAGLSFDEALAFWRSMHRTAADELGRLSDAQLAAPGPPTPAIWSRPHLVDIVTALIAHYQAHMAER